ncbi:MAG: GNAT family N-acetyltransferase [Sediminibacterium sp.]|jgi:ElaA protein|nr:GNAT family N-acetyltransferase [Chitinophagaceae bacterium]MCA6448403.1 GNAT family N-acetyltransferase [Chitinophagaceae bacterium]
MKAIYNIYYKPFEALSPYELYDAIKLRNEVFVVEQNCIFQDADGKDLDAFHLFIYQEEKLLAYSRLIAAGLGYKEMSIGRIVSSPAARGMGIGRVLVAESIKACKQLFGEGPIRIGAQYYLLNFYRSFGFKEEGDIYLEDGIEHIEMVL